MLRVARCSAVKARSQATNQLKALLVTAPAELREQLRTLSNTKLIATCAGLRPTGDIADPEPDDGALGIGLHRGCIRQAVHQCRHRATLRVAAHDDVFHSQDMHSKLNRGRG